MPNVKKPEWKKLKSKNEQPSFLKKVRYDPKTKDLDIEFAGGRKYRYHGASQEAIDKLLDESRSSGSDFNVFIKGLDYERL